VFTKAATHVIERINCYRFRVYFELVICKCCCVIDQRNVQTHETQELAGFQRSELIPCNSGKYNSYLQLVANDNWQTMFYYAVSFYIYM